MFNESGRAFAQWSSRARNHQLKNCEKEMTTAGLEPATFWYRWAIEAKRATIALGSH